VTDPRKNETRESDRRDHVIDALLAQHFRENARTMETRYTRAFDALIARERAEDATHTRRPTTRIQHTSRFVSLARAALIALAFGTLLLFFPTTTRASGVLDRVLAAETRGDVSRGDRRYDIEVVLPPLPRKPDDFFPRDRRRPSERRHEAGSQREPQPSTEIHSEFGTEMRPDVRLVGTWDLRGGESRLDLTAPGFPTVTRVDSERGAWERRGDGVVRTLDERGIWPRWIRDPHGEIAVERMDGLLRLVQRSYLVAFARAGEESPEHLRGALHLVASRQGDVIGPTEIDLWIDTARNVVLEARLTWLPPAPREHDVREHGVREHGVREGMRGEFREGMREPPRNSTSTPHGTAPPPDDYRPSRGTLPPFPPRELFLRRVEPITFPPDHFTMPTIVTR
jgi:hypothetical protein